MVFCFQSVQVVLKVIGHKLAHVNAILRRVVLVPDMMLMSVLMLRMLLRMLLRIVVLLLVVMLVQMVGLKVGLYAWL